MSMTPEALKAIAKKHGGYANPKLNDVLYLHCQGFGKVENLEPYTEVKVLWLEQNALDTIEGLEENKQLMTLFLQNNAISKITGLQSLSNLRIINLSHNYIGSISNIATFCPLLESLQISHNKIERLEDCTELLEFKCLSSLDISYNKISRPEGSDDSYVYSFFSKMPAIAVLYLQGQSLSNGIKHYRKNMIWNIKTLTYLDERPVFAEERRTVEAWGEGGNAAESATRDAIRKEKHDHLTGCVKTLVEMAEKMKDVREARTIEYEKQKEAERKRRQENLAARRAVDYDEGDARIIINTDESSEWVELVACLGQMLLVAEEEEEKRREQRVLEEAAQREFAKEEAALTALVKAAEVAKAEEKNKKREEVAFWVKQMEMTEDEIITQMEDEMTEMLKMMRPAGGYRDIAAMAKEAVEAAPNSKTTSPSKSAAAEERKRKEEEQRQQHADPMANVDGMATGVASDSIADKPLAGTTIVPSKKTKFSKEKVWAQYDAWESLQMGRRGQRSA